MATATTSPLRQKLVILSWRTVDQAVRGSLTPPLIALLSWKYLLFPLAKMIVQGVMYNQLITFLSYYLEWCLNFFSLQFVALGSSVEEELCFRKEWDIQWIAKLKENLFFHLSIIFLDILEFQVLHRQVTETLVPSHFVLSQDFIQMLTPGFLHKQLKSLPGWRQHLFPWGRSIKRLATISLSM